MFWGVISREDPVCFTNATEEVKGLKVFGKIKTLKAQYYLEMLMHHSIPHLDRVNGERNADAIFQQDGASIHTCGQLTAFFEREGIVVPSWPSNSPDLSPIENVWGIMKAELSLGEIETLEDLEDVVTRLWHEHCTPELCEKLHASVKARLEKVIQDDGYRTSY
ncbi:hypothetical protein BV898_17569 [Hypsibius exemplaris]|uniref:Tc1-like transposase DDE domain-containing protein n=1 Tax=Hypsibius exemplaris TaxID=2072580 RepID=A0A9X6RMA5_HYPEX|nr:hypothetical protein BV898_17569 [Hypsibius exemplaris]